MVFHIKKSAFYTIRQILRKKYDKIHKTNEKILKLPKIEQKIESLGMKWIYLK